MGYWTQYSIQALAPLILFGVLFFIGALKHVIFCWKNRHFIKAVYKSEASPFERSFAFYLFFLTSLFTFIASVAFSPFRCFQQVDGLYTLISNPSEDCYDGVWFSHIWVIAFALLFIIAVPVIIFFLLRSYRGGFQSNEFVWRFGLLTNIYKDKYYYWELMSMFRKTLIVVFVDLLGNYSRYVKTFLLIIFLVSWMSLEAWVEPYKHEGFSSVLAYL
jgi:hypothetical protein